MNKIRGFIGIVLVAGGVLASAGSTPALAAGGPSGSLFVGTCNKNALPDLPAAVDAANALPRAMRKTITVCPGTHLVLSTLAIATDNLTIKGKNGAALTIPDGWTMNLIAVSGANKVTIQGLAIHPGIGYSGELIIVTGSRGVTLRKLLIDGQGMLSPDGSTAINFVNTSGSIISSQVLGWHTPDFSGFADPIQAGGTGSQAVKLAGNIITNYQGRAINGDRLAAFTVTGNRISGTATDPDPVAFEGITMAQIKSGRITGNTVTGGTPPGGTGTTGILVDIADGLKVGGNRISHWETGLMLTSDCAPSVTINNRLTGNQINEVSVGIWLASGGGSTCNETVDHNTITGNRIVNTLAQGLIGIKVTADSGGGFISTAKDETVRGNTIIHFLTGITAPLPDPANHITGVFKPNTIRP